MASYSQELWYGKSPVRRTNPKAGQSEYYYIDPRYPNATNGANEIDVPSADSPNPKAAEIQNYLNEFDPDAYKSVYGDEPPAPLINIPNTTNTSYDNGTGFSSVFPSDGESVNGFAPISAMDPTQPMINTSFSSSAPQSNNWWDTAKDTVQNAWDSVGNTFSQVQNAVSNWYNSPQSQNSLLMSGMDTLYGMNRAINGMTFGGLDYAGEKLGFDSQMNDYLSLKDNMGEGTTTRLAGTVAEFGGGMLFPGAGAKTAKEMYDTTKIMYQTSKPIETTMTMLSNPNIVNQGRKIGKAYDKLKKNPYAGHGEDVIATMTDYFGNPVVLQRGHAIPGVNGKPIVHGKKLGRETGTVQNFGVNKFIYRHDMPRQDVQRLPKIIREKPASTNEFGQNIYITNGERGQFKSITSPASRNSIVSSMYYPD